MFHFTTVNLKPVQHLEVTVWTVHRSNTGIVKAVDITPGLYEGAEPRKGAAVFNSKQRCVHDAATCNSTYLM